VDAVELLGGEAPFIADTSAWWRFSSLPDELAGLIKAAVADERSHVSKKRVALDGPGLTVTRCRLGTPGSR
jgi:hypothetical protein